MKFTQTIAAALITGSLMFGVSAAPTAAYAASPGGTTVADDVVVDGRIITAENYDSADARTDDTLAASTASADADDDDHDILYDPDDDLMPPVKPVGDAEPTPAFDGRLLTAQDLTRE